MPAVFIPTAKITLGLVHLVFGLSVLAFRNFLRYLVGLYFIFLGLIILFIL